MTWSLLLVFAFLGGEPQGSVEPLLNEPVFEAAQTVSGTTFANAVELFVRESADSKGRLIRHVVAKTGEVDTSKRTFAVALGAPLQKGQFLTVCTPAVPSDAAAVPPIAAVAQICSPTAVAVQASEPIRLQMPLRDGSRVVSGSASAPMTGVEVTVRTKTDPANYVQRVKAVPVSGLFIAPLSQPLLPGEQVTVCGQIGDVRLADCPSVPVENAGDWGRVRAYFAGGVIFSKEHDDFSSQDLALSFTLDKNWAQSNDETCKKCVAFNTFFDTRLTSVPIGGSTTTATTPPGGTTSTTTSQFIDSKKAVLMQGGIYIPYYRPAWRWIHEGRTNAVFIAPVIRGGVVTTTEAADTAGTNDDGVFKSWSIGFGVGHEELGSKNSAPAVISYFHMTFGKWDNLGDKARMVLEGRLKIPDTPFQVGFDGNLPVHKKDDSPPSDLRFIVGTRFDIGELLGKLKVLGS